METNMTPNANVIDRIRKLLALTKSENQHEAALAAARAAELMERHRIEEASLQLDHKATAEPITEETLESKGARKRCAWKGGIASGLTRAFGAKMYWNGPHVQLYGRTSSLQAIRYTYCYLVNEVDRLADETWLACDAKQQGQDTRVWKNAFRLGAASVIGQRLREQRQAEVERRKRGAYQPVMDESETTQDVTVASIDISRALAVVARDEEEVEASFARRTKGFGTYSYSGRARNYSAWDAGRAAGRNISLGGGKALKSPAPKLPR